MVGQLDRTIERRLLESVAGEELLRLFLGKTREVRLHLRADRHHLAPLLVGIGLERGDVRVGGRIGEVVFGHVGAVDHALVRQEMEILQDRQDRIAVLARERTDGMALLEVLQERAAGLGLGTKRRLRLGFLLDAVVALLELFHVRQDEFRLDHLGIAGGIDRGGLVATLLDVDDVIVFEATDDMQDRIALADVREELVAETFALGRALHKARDVGEFDGRANDLLRIVNLRQLLETGVLHLDDGGIRLDRAERIVLGGGLLLLGEGVKQGRLADVRQAHDTYGETHSLLTS